MERNNSYTWTMSMPYKQMNFYQQMYVYGYPWKTEIETRQ